MIFVVEVLKKKDGKLCNMKLIVTSQKFGGKILVEMIDVFLHI